MAQRVAQLFGGGRKSYQMVLDPEDELEFSDDESVAFAVPPPPDLPPQDLNAPVLPLRRSPLLCEELPQLEPATSEGTLLRKWSGRDQRVLDTLHQILLTLRRHSDFDYYAKLVPGLVRRSPARALAGSGYRNARVGGPYVLYVLNVLFSHIIAVFNNHIRTNTTQNHTQYDRRQKRTHAHSCTYLISQTRTRTHILTRIHNDAYKYVHVQSHPYANLQLHIRTRTQHTHMHTYTHVHNIFS